MSRSNRQKKKQVSKRAYINAKRRCVVLVEGPDSILSTQERESVKNTRLIEQALREGWEIPERLKAGIVNRMTQIVEDKKRGDREVISASRVAVSIEALNVRERIAYRRMEQAERFKQRHAEDREFRPVASPTPEAIEQESPPVAAIEQATGGTHQKIKSMTAIKIEYVDDWYGSSSEAAEAAETSEERLAGLGEIQAAHLRSPLGQELDGAAGSP